MDAADALKRMLNIPSPIPNTQQQEAAPEPTTTIDFSQTECGHTVPLTGAHVSVVASPSSAAAQRSTSSPNNLEVMTFSLYNTAPEVYSGRLVAMNDNYVAYGVKLRAGYGVRILHRHTSQRGMVRDHLTPLVDMAFMGPTSDVLATMDQTGHVIVSAVSSGADATADLIVMRGCHIYDEQNQHVPTQNAFSSGALAWLSCDGHGRLLVGKNGSRTYVCDVSALREAVGEQPINIGAGLFNGIRYVPNISNVTVVSPNSGGIVALAGADGSVSFVDKLSLDVVAMTTAANLGLGSVDHMSFVDEHHMLICGNSNSHVVLYHLQQQKELQRLSFRAPGGGVPCLYVSVDASSNYMLLSDTHEATLYVVNFAGDAEKSFSQILEFNSTLPMLSFVCADATIEETEDMSDNAEYNQMKQETRIVVFTAQSKAMQQLTLRFPPPSTNEIAENATSSALGQSDAVEVNGVLPLTPDALTQDSGSNPEAVGSNNDGSNNEAVGTTQDSAQNEAGVSDSMPVLTPTAIRQLSNHTTPTHSHTHTPTGTITPTAEQTHAQPPNTVHTPEGQGADRSTEHPPTTSDSPAPALHTPAVLNAPPTTSQTHTPQSQSPLPAHTQPPMQQQSNSSRTHAHTDAQQHGTADSTASAPAQIQILKRGEADGHRDAAVSSTPPPQSEGQRSVDTSNFEKQFTTFRTEMEDSQRALLRLVKESTERNKKVVEEYNDRSLSAVVEAVDKHMSQMRRDLAAERQQMVGEIQNSIVTATDRAVLNSITQTVMPQLVMQFEQITRDVAGQVFASKPVIDHITISAAKAMKPALAETFSTAMQQAMIPACEGATREMFRQVSSALTERTDTYIEAIRTQSHQFSSSGEMGQSLANTESAVQQLTQRLGQVSATLDTTTAQTTKVLTAVQDSKAAVLKSLIVQQRATTTSATDMLSRQSSTQSVVRSGYTTPTSIPIPQPQQQMNTLQQPQQAQNMQQQHAQQQIPHHQQQPPQQQQQQSSMNAQNMIYPPPPQQQQQQQQQQLPQQHTNTQQQHRPPQQQMQQQMQQQQPPQRQSVAQPQPNKLAPGETPEDLWVAINKLLLAEKYEGAFNKALNAVHLPTLERLCTTLDMERILKSQPSVISQPVLLSLIQQLSTNLKTSTAMKLTVVRAALTSLDRNDKIVQQHRMGLLQQVSNSLKAFKAASPYHSSLSEVDRLLQDTSFDRL